MQALQGKQKETQVLTAQFAHFSYSQTEEGPQDGCRVTSLTETWQLLPAFHAGEASLQNSSITFNADVQCPQASL